MAKTKKQKKEMLKSLEDKIGRAKAIVFARFNGLTVKENEIIRDELKGNESEYLVVKKTLLNLALANREHKDIDVSGFDGQVAAVFGYNDEIMPAKIMAKHKQAMEEKIDFFGGILENRFIDADSVVELSKIPSREELYAKLVGSLSSPISGLLNVFTGTQRKFVYALKAIQEKKA